MNLSIIFQSLLLLFFSFLLYLYTKNQQSTKKPTIYGLKSYPIIGYLPHVIQNSHRILDWMTELMLRSPTRTIGFRTIGSTYGILTANPANVEHMLKLNSNNYPKGQRTISMMEDFVGHGIFNSDGDEWKWQRKTASFEFNKKSLRNYGSQAAEKGVKVELQDVLERFAFDNICRVAFGEDPACLTEEEVSSGSSTSQEFMDAFTIAQDLSTARFSGYFENLWRIKKFLNIGSEKRLKKALSIVHGYSMRIIRSRMLKGMELDGRQDLLSRFASIKDINEDMLRDIVTMVQKIGRFRFESVESDRNRQVPSRFWWV
ncbi:Cytochrome P450 94A1 [Rhynchospora pubera]|uniref:Cytochrome P450 94A1 n=1 Tax=Rhynchospora pubera TaxID=906938 RepID=A0AAV8F0F4_9POAL|nr:Cytochrome P450 94A1 [Rhynchospora pubera]